MTSSNKEFDNENTVSPEEEYAIDRILYVESVFDQFENDEVDLVSVELPNRQIIVCFIEWESPDILILPVHLYETTSDIDGNYTPTFSFASYNGLADKFAEIIVPGGPSLIYTPKSDIILKFFEYWEITKNSMLKDVNIDESDVLYNDSGTLLKS